MSGRLVHIVLSIASFAVPAIMLAWRLPQREGIAWRRVIAALCVVAFSALAFGPGAIPPTGESSGFDTTSGAMPWDMYRFAAVIIITGALTFLCRKCSPWTALLCSASAYTMQNLGTTLSRVVNSLIPYGTGEEAAPAICMIVCSALSYYLCYLLFIREGNLGVRFEVAGWRVVLVVLAVVVINVFADSAMTALTATSVSMLPTAVLGISHAVTCLLTLFLVFELVTNRRLEGGIAITNKIMQERERQYKTSRETLDALVGSLHDMRHRVLRLLTKDPSSGSLSKEELRDIAKEMDVLDARTNTGNEALDTVLTEKILVCKRCGISLSYVVDGSVLSGFRPEDVYTFFSMAIDDATAGMKNDSASRNGSTDGSKSISLEVGRRSEMLFVHIERPREGTTRGGTPWESLPVLSEIVARQNGIVSAGSKQGLDYLNALIPMPDQN